jgi:short-subunit dehydrogenase
VSNISPSDTPTTLITGATDGIGLALARRYSDRGHRLILVGRRESGELEDPIFSDDTYCQVDLAAESPGPQLRSFLETKRCDRIDTLILNAGTGYWGETDGQAEASIRNTVAVNLGSAISLTHCCHPYLKAASGRVVLIGSVVAALPCPDYAVYGATKAAVDGFGRSLTYDFSPDVSVQVIHPGPTRSGLHAKIGVDKKKVDWTRFASTDTVAGQIERQIDGKSIRRVLGLGTSLMWLAGRRFPCIIDFAMRRA